MEQMGNYIVCTPLLAIIVNCALAVVYFTLAVIIDSRKQTAYTRQDTRVPTWFPRYLEADADVKKEENFVHSPAAESADISVKVKDLNKVYGNGYPAVSGTSFHIKKNEVLGLLGPNGAGKSTTFSILTMDQPKSFGEVRVLGTQIENFDCQLQGKYLGLAAQANVIWDTLTVDEHLNFIGKVKGLSPAEITFQSKFIKETLDLTPFGDKQAG